MAGKEDVDGLPEVPLTKAGDPLALVVVPSKELALQVTHDIAALATHANIRMATIVGGVGEATQIKRLETGVDIIVGTPGRLLQLVEAEHVSLRQVQITVIDEFDKLFNMGFFPDTKDLFAALPRVANRTRGGMQTVLTSATVLHSRLDDLISRFAPMHVMVNLNRALRPAEGVREHFYRVPYRKKRSLLLYFMRRGGKTSLKTARTLVFARTQQRVDNLAQALNESGIKAVAIHADMATSKRAAILEEFRNGEYRVLVATDVMTRGMHIDDLDAVVNYDVPHVAEDYIHRVGRVGRAGRTGFSLTFVASERLVFDVGMRTVGLDESNLLGNIETLTAKTTLFSKIPGPWDATKDDAQDEIAIKVNVDEQAEYEAMDAEHAHNKGREKRAVTDMLLKKNIIETFRGPKSHDGLPKVRFNPNAKIKNRKMAKLKIDRKGEIRDLPPITDFAEGRYEAVVNEFDKRRARKRGVGLAADNKKVFLPSKIMTKRQEKRGPSSPPPSSTSTSNNYDDYDD
eukprot:gene19977-23939_t